MEGKTYTHLRPRSLQFEQEGWRPALEMGRSLRSHLTLDKGGEHGGREQKGRSEVKDAEWR